MASQILPIAVVGRETGISPDLLRKWEIRYGFPQPVRSPAGVRGYPLTQVEQLHEVKRLMESGIRAGEAIRRVLGSRGTKDAASPSPRSGQDVVDACLEALRAHDLPGLHALLDRSLASLGVRDFITGTVAPLVTAVGDAWLAGSLRVHEEHLFSATLTTFLSELHRRLHLRTGTPRVLLTTAPGELHTLGLDMVRVLFSEADAACISLGAQTPLAEMAAAVTAYGAQILALSFSAAYPRRALTSSLSELRALVPPDVSIWIGGSGTLAVSRLPDGIEAFVTANDAVGALRQQVARH